MIPAPPAPRMPPALSAKEVERRYPLGARVYATRASGVSAEGEPGVVVEAYDLGWGPGRSVYFLLGGFDGFSAEHLDLMLIPEGSVDERAAAYVYSSIGELKRDVARGAFGFWGFAPYAECLAREQAKALESAIASAAPSRPGPRV